MPGVEDTGVEMDSSAMAAAEPKDLGKDPCRVAGSRVLESCRLAVLAPGLSGRGLRRRDFRGDFGKLVVMLALVVLR